MPKVKYADICVIGAGSGGLTVAAGASQMGAKTILVEAGEMGGDCLNSGCVPSKSLIAAAHSAHTITDSLKFGIQSKFTVDFEKVHNHVHDVIETISHHDSVERFTALGVEVIKESAEFVSPNEIRAGKVHVKARRFVIATGSSPAIPPIPGLLETPYLTNETIFNQKTLPKHLIIIGGGPIGVEMAQSFKRLGSDVTIIEMFSILGKDDPEVTSPVRKKLIDEGIDLREKIKIKLIEKSAAGVSVHLEKNAQTTKISGSHLLVATGRQPNIKKLNLAAAEVETTVKGIVVDRRLRTTNKKIFAIGDVVGDYQFTHMASYHAGIVIRNALFMLPAKVNYQAVPWVTYTDPEIAHVGMTEEMAKYKNKSIQVLRWSFDENDRAQTEKKPEGLIKVVVSKRGKILGASIVGAHAGELLMPWIVAVHKKMHIKDIAGIIAPYPTLSEISKRAAGSFYMNKLFSDKTKKIVQFIQKTFK